MQPTGVHARRLGVRCLAAGLLLCSSLVLFLGTPEIAAAQGECVAQGECPFRKPNVLILLDYSSSMVGFEQNPNYDPEGRFTVTRWDAQLEAVRWILGYDGGVVREQYATHARALRTRPEPRRHRHSPRQRHVVSSDRKRLRPRRALR